MKCERCGKPHDGSFGSGRFCSRECANSRGPRSDDFKQKVREKLVGRTGWRKGILSAPRAKIKCKTCGVEFIAKEKEHRQYCSQECWLTSKEVGGYREGSGRSKCGYYKGIYCGSSWELAWLIYAIDHNINFKRFKGVLEGNGIKYIPDFIVENTIIEIKGYEKAETVDKKTALAESFGYNVKVLRKPQLKPMFDYVKNNYEYKQLWDLYD